MNTPVNVIEVTPSKTEELRIPYAKAQGWMAFTSIGSDPDAMQVWSQVYGLHNAERDMYRCPYPLFPTRDDAVAAAMKMLPNGGSVKLFKVEL